MIIRDKAKSRCELKQLCVVSVIPHHKLGRGFEKGLRFRKSGELVCPVYTIGQACQQYFSVELDAAGA